MGKAAVPESYLGKRVVTAAEMAELDRRAAAEFGLAAVELMENAGRAVAEEAARFLGERLGRDVSKAAVTICCGRGNNGGDGLAAGRYLRERGAAVHVFMTPPRRALSGPGSYPPEVSENLRRAAAAAVAVRELGPETAELDERLRACDLAVDALLGTGSSGKPAGAVRLMIQRMMKAGRPVIAVDVPSGLHPDTGYHSGVFVEAVLTLTLGLPKRGLLYPHARRQVGELKVLDIGFPEALLGGGA